MHNTRLAIIALLAGGITAAPAAAQSAQDILNAAMERHRARAASIDNYTVVQNTMGAEVTMYFEKEMVNGAPVFVSRSSSVGGTSMSLGSSQVMTDLTRIAESSTYLGRETIDGHPTHALRIDDPGALGISDAVTQNAGDDFEASAITMYLDAEEYMPRRILFEGSMSVNGQTRPITSTIDFTDYRNIDGLLHPFVTTFNIEGAMDAMQSGMSKQEIAEARKQLDEFDKQMAEMPESQRAMMERMMGDRMKQLRAMLESGGTKFSIEVSEVRVNAGPPGG